MPVPEPGIFILSGPVQSGKTTSLLQWSEEREDVYGILTPVVNGRRVFIDPQTRAQFPMEAGQEETEVISVGRFRFSKAGFGKAIEIVRGSIQQNGWLILDEIGPLELRGEGFHDALKEVLKTRTGAILLVVREGLVQQVQDHFGFSAATIDSINQL